MAETPKTREELFEAASKGTYGDREWVIAVIEAIESLGLRIVPEEASEEMLSDAGYMPECGFETVYSSLVKASPFAPEKDNG